MARRRQAAQTAQYVEDTNTQKESKVMSSLDVETIQDLLSGSRTKGAGTDVLRDFLNSGEAGMEIDNSSGPFAGKEPGQIYTALTNAKKATTTDPSGATVLKLPEAKNVKVIKRNFGDKDNPNFRVFLIDTSKIEA